MFRKMRRSGQSLSGDEIGRILKKCDTGVLAVCGDDGYPYAVPVNFVYDGEAGVIYFHCARDGHKLDAIRRDEKVSFCVVGKDRVMPEKFATEYESVILFGRASLVEDSAEKRAALEMIVQKYSADYVKEGEDEIQRFWDRVGIVRIQIDHMTGKSSKKQ